MSSLAAARADNFYHPPDWNPQKVSRDKFQGSRGSNQYEQRGVIRFEMPFNVKCLGCKAMIGKGVRFNAKKEQAGNYFSTKIWNFTMSCHHCQHRLVVSTDPKNTDYALTSGLERKTETYDAADAGTAELMSADEREKIARDPFTNLEHKGKLQQQAAQDKPIISQLHGISNDRWQDDYEVNRSLRRKFRGDKKEIKKKSEQRDRDIARTGVPLLPLSAEDRVAAARTNFVGLSASATQQKKRQLLMAGPILPSAKTTAKSLGAALGRPLKRSQPQIASARGITKRPIVRR